LDDQRFALDAQGSQRESEIARRLRKETTISLKWIAARLEMGSWTHAANRIYEKNTKEQRKV
jgi:DNA-binding CsgD family transcriptional regulator